MPEALLTDLYQLTMSGAYYECGFRQDATFEWFIRKLPQNRSYVLAAGLDNVLDFLQSFSFTQEEIDYLKSLPDFQTLPKDFFKYLRDLEFTGDVWAMPEGTVFFPGEPILRVTAPIIQAQIVETYVLSQMNLQSLVCTKASRIVQAAQGRGIVDFGSRRAHGPQAGVLAARACYIAGCQGTSNLEAGFRYGIPVFGTCAHSFIQAFDVEEDAFQKFYDVYGDQTILLIDTYDTVEGARKATAFGEKIKGVRLDSGDLLVLSKEVRKILDEAGLKDCKMVLSGDMNEYRIADLIANGAQVDSFGVGTAMVISDDAPTLNPVYKLVEQDFRDRREPVLKLSENKATYPSRKQVYRIKGEDGLWVKDVIALDTEEPPENSVPLLEQVMVRGHRSLPKYSLNEPRKRVQDGWALWPAEIHVLEGTYDYPVEYSEDMEKLREEVIAKIK